MYETLLKEEIFFGIQLLRREIHHEVGSIAMIMFESIVAIQEFAGGNEEAVRCTIEGKKVIVSFRRTVATHEARDEMKDV